jgi:hypothetical protein
MINKIKCCCKNRFRQKWLQEKIGGRTVFAGEWRKKSGVLKVHRVLGVHKVHRVYEDGGDNNFQRYKTIAHCC